MTSLGTKPEQVVWDDAGDPCGMAGAIPMKDVVKTAAKIEASMFVRAESEKRVCTREED